MIEAGLNADALRVMFALSRDRQDNEDSGSDRDELAGIHPDFDTVLNLYHKKIYNLIYRIMANPNDVADLTQEVFVKAYKAYNKFRGPSGAIYPWLCKIAVNSCNSKFRELGQRNRYEAFSLDEPLKIDDKEVSLELSDGASDPADILAYQDLEAAVQSAINDLQPEYRIVIVLRDMQGLSYKEISEASGLEIDVVRARLHRARVMLRRRLSAYITE